VKVGPSNLGRVLVDASGKTLYLWARDKGGKSSCYAGYAEFWPPLLTTGKPVAGAGALARLVGTAVRRDGRRQVTYPEGPIARPSKPCPRDALRADAPRRHGRRCSTETS
jgi:predicted lipoprotein with Yx(FWY)xxD motif